MSSKDFKRLPFFRMHSTAFIVCHGSPVKKSLSAENEMFLTLKLEEMPLEPKVFRP